MRERNPITETNGRRRKRTDSDWPQLRAHLDGRSDEKRIGGKTLSGPRRPALCFIYSDLADLEELEPTPVFGMYPASFIPKILPDARPDILADGRHLPFRTGSVEAVLLDPPYTEHYARDLYGVKYPRPSHLLREAARVVKPCGRIGFVHYITPNPPPSCRVVKVFGLSTGFGFPMRAVTIYQREQSAFALGGRP